MLSDCCLQKVEKRYPIFFSRVGMLAPPLLPWHQDLPCHCRILWATAPRTKDLLFGKVGTGSSTCLRYWQRSAEPHGMSTHAGREKLAMFFDCNAAEARRTFRFWNDAKALVLRERVQGVASNHRPPQTIDIAQFLLPQIKRYGRRPTWGRSRAAETENPWKRS